jgi:threonine/homoserine/homoserine lactone efflux protein
MLMAVLAQTVPQDTSSGAGIVFGMLALIGVVSVVAITPRGRRSLMPAVAVLLGVVIAYTSLADARNATFSVITVLGLFIGVVLVFGGFGALREGIALPPVEGKEPEIEPRAPAIERTPSHDAADSSAAP